MTEDEGKKKKLTHQFVVIQGDRTPDPYKDLPPPQRAHYAHAELTMSDRKHLLGSLGPALAYAVVSLLALCASVPAWRWMGLL